MGARRGLVVLEPGDGLGPDTTIGLGLAHADLGHIETVPRSSLSYGRILDGLPGGDAEIAEPDLFAEDGLDPRHREVAARLGYAASYALPLRGGVHRERRPPRRRRVALRRARRARRAPAPPVGLYARYAAEHLARLLEVERTRACMATIAEELLPSRLPRVAGVQLAARHRTGPRGGGDWYDALPLPDAALGLAVGSVTGSGASAVAAMGRLRASLRAYAVMEGEDPVAVLSDLELLLRLTEPARSATALFAYCEPALRKITLAGAGHCPPLLVGERRTEFVETSVSAPLGHARLLGGAERGAPGGGRARRFCCTPTGCCTAPATPPTAPSPGCTRRRPACPGRCATTRTRSPTTSCGRCCRTGWTGRTPRRTSCCWRLTSSDLGADQVLRPWAPLPYDRTMDGVQCRI